MTIVTCFVMHFNIVAQLPDSRGERHSPGLGPPFLWRLMTVSSPDD